jgi:tetratricopeptide (TPR) repeat protein
MKLAVPNWNTLRTSNKMKINRPEGVFAKFGRTLTPRQWTLIALLLPPLTAVILRILAFKELLNSPLRYYSSVGGLDMQGLLNLGRWLYEGRGIFSIYSGLAAFVMLLNGGQEWPEALIVIQYACGTILAFLIAWIALRLTGRRGVALTAGMAAALYAPELMYESVTLRESVMVFACTLSLALVVTWRRRHFANWRMVAVGAILALPCLVRASAGLWTALAMLWVWAYILRKQRVSLKTDWLKALRKGALIGVGAIILLLPSWGWNYFAQGYPLPFYLNIGYSVKAGKVDNARTMNVEMSKTASAAALQTEPESCPVPSTEASGRAACKVVCPFIKYGKKFIEVFLPFEKANNLNFYYMRQKFPILTNLLRPEILITLATVMLIWWLLRGACLRKEAILFIYLIALTIPMCVFLPLARYRLALLPVFCIAGAVLPVRELNLLLRKKSIWKFAIIIVALLVYCKLTWPKVVPVRSEDFIAWGKAMKSRGDQPIMYLREFRDGYLLQPESASAAFNFAGALLQIRKFEDAAKVCLNTLRAHPDNQGLKLYAASGFTGSGRPQAAERILLSIKEPSDHTGYYYNLGECLRLQKRYADAVKAYSNALKGARTERQKGYLKRQIAILAPKLKENK